MAEHMLGLPVKHKFKDIKGRDHNLLTNVTANQHHRKWAWADEQTWSRMYHLPYACLETGWDRQNNGNPVLTPAGWEAPAGVACPTVVKCNSYYYMIYTGNAGRLNAKFGIARSTDKITWTKSSDNPILRNDATWESYGLYYPYLVVDNKEGLYRLWYTGCQNLAPTYPFGIGYAYCPLTSDPMVRANWTKYAGNPILMNYCTMGALKLGKVVYLLTSPNMSGIDGIHMHFSKDGTTLTYFGRVMTLGSAGQWDDYSTFYSTVFWNLGIFYLIYAGRRSGVEFKLGLSLAGSDGTSYSKLFGNLGNPFFGWGASGKFDQSSVFGPSLMMENKSFWMWYTGYYTDYRIGLAKLDLDY